MGREIRRVPKGWEHPKDVRSHFVALLDQTYEEALTEWNEEKRIFDAIGASIRVDRDGDIEFEGKQYKIYHEKETTFEDWHGDEPESDRYRQKFESEPTHYQVYENVTEGTPTSPVFESLEEMKAWLIEEEGHSEKAATAFCKDGYAPSFVITDKGVSGLGIDSLDDFLE